MRKGACVAVAVAVMGAATARADGPELHSRLVYSVPSGCPDERRFRELLAQHSEVVVDDAAPITLHVSVTKDPKRHRGRVALVAREEEGVREVAAERCEDVVRGLALFSAIALDAYFSRRPLAEEAPPTPPTPTPPPTVREKPRRPRARASVISPPMAESKPTLKPEFGIGLGEMNATGSRVLAHLGAFGELALTRGLRSSLRAGVHVGAVVPQSYREGSLSFWMGWVRVDACPAWLQVSPALFVSLCPTGDLGFQRAALGGAAGGRSEVRPWVAVGAVARLRTRVAPMAELEASAGALAPLLPFDFRTLSGIAYATPAVVPVVELALILPLF